VREIASVNVEFWVGLQAQFLREIATHSSLQEFYYGDDHLLRRRDYMVDVAGGFPAVHYVYDIVEADGTKRQRIPDAVTGGLIGDVKDVQEQSLDAQLRDFYTIAKLHDPDGKPCTVLEADGKTEVKSTRDFGLAYRKKTPTQEETHLSGPLKGALDLKKDVITDTIEEGK